MEESDVRWRGLACDGGSDGGSDVRQREVVCNGMRQTDMQRRGLTCDDREGFPLQINITSTQQRGFSPPLHQKRHINRKGFRGINVTCIHEDVVSRQT
jgi:hypothetical protein